MKGLKYIHAVDDIIKVKKEAEELEKFLQDRLSEDDFKKFVILFKELMIFSFDKIKALLNDDLNLDQFTGTEHYYNHLGRQVTGIKYTDGIKYLADKTNCYWFIDIIASYQESYLNDAFGKVKDCHFQIWKLKVIGKSESKQIDALVTMREDTDEEPRVSQSVLYTDFPLDEIEVYCIDGIILLKSEY